MKEHPKFVELMPPLTPEEYGQLKKNITTLGYREDEPVLLWNDYIIDGHNRNNICKELSITPPTFDMTAKFKDENEVLLWIIDNQLGRRNLPIFVRADLTLKKESIIHAKAEQHLKLSQGRGIKGLENSLNLIEPIHTDKILAKDGGISDDTIRRVRFLNENADTKTLEKLRAGEETINKTYTTIKRQIQRDDQTIRLSGKTTLPEGKFDVILADPPWRYDFTETENREIENQYPSMSLEEIKLLPIPSADDSVLFIWATAPKIKEALDTMKAWGFEYKTHSIWDKVNIGMGYWFRGRHELLLVGTKGNVFPPTPENRPDSIFVEKRREHSQKPERAYEIIESMFPNGKYLELFARNKRDKWVGWGNEQL